MLKEDTIKREMRRLRKIIDERNLRCTLSTKAFMSDMIAREAYGMECALQWVLGGCTWTPSGLVSK